MGQVMTVRGPIEGSELGVTLPHEHVLISMAYAFPAAGPEATRPITMDQLGVLRNDMMRNVNTITLDESSDPVGELDKARQAGVDTIGGPDSARAGSRSDRAGADLGDDRGQHHLAARAITCACSSGPVRAA